MPKWDDSREWETLNCHDKKIQTNGHDECFDEEMKKYDIVGNNLIMHA